MDRRRSGAARHARARLGGARRAGPRRARRRRRRGPVGRGVRGPRRRRRASPRRPRPLRRSLPPTRLIEGGTAMTSTSASHAAPATSTGGTRCRIVRGGEGYEGRQGLSYAAGISAESAGAHGLCLHSVTIPPGGRAKAHRHESHESAIYTVSGRCEFWWGEGLVHRDEVRAGRLRLHPRRRPAPADQPRRRADVRGHRPHRPQRAGERGADARARRRPRRRHVVTGLATVRPGRQGPGPTAQHVEPTPRRIRVRLGSRLVADSTRALLMIRYGPKGLPTYFVPRDDVAAGRARGRVARRRRAGRRGRCAPGRPGGRRGLDRPAPEARRTRDVLLAPARLVRGGRAGRRARAEPVRAGRHAAQLAARGDPGRRRDGRAQHPAAAAVRDPPAHALLPAVRRRARGVPRGRATPSPSARTRGGRGTGRCGRAGWSCPTPRGAIRTRSRRTRRSATSSASSPSGSISSSTASRSRGRCRRGPTGRRT